MRITKKQRVIGGSVVAVLVLGLAGFGIWQWNEASGATAVYEQSDDELRQANGDRNSAAKELNAARANALAAHTTAGSIVAAADPAMLETPTLRDELTAANTLLAETAGLAANESGAFAVPEAVAGTRVPKTAAPEGREAKISAAKQLTIDAKARTREARELSTQVSDIVKAEEAVEALEIALIGSAHAKGAAIELPEQASQESKDAFTGAVAALQAPTEGADFVALLQGYQDAYAAVIASTEAAAQAGGIEPTYINGILIANKTYALPEWWGDGITAETLAAFEAMSAEAAASGHDLYISSGFRSYATQASIYNSLVAQVGVAGADRDTARPGHSEHQTGLTVDLNCICEGFGHQADGQWVAANAHRFGFIVRYPPGKEHVTGYIWEPWHLRYLGVENATAVYNSGLTLEEYLGITSSYS